MATIHHTTMTPTKLELLAAWLPKQSWYVSEAPGPDLVNAGGFRLDDPDGAVGIEFMVVVDTAGSEPRAYLAPMSYRGAVAKEAPREALIGTSEHGVLGRRHVYDGLHDPVATAQLRALLRGEAEPQRQSVSDAPDPTVAVHGEVPEDGFELRVNRVLRPTSRTSTVGAAVVAGWTWPDGSTARGEFAAATPL